MKTLKQLVNEHMLAVWEATHHRPQVAARVLGISRGTMYRWLWKQGLLTKTVAEGDAPVEAGAAGRAGPTS